MVASLKAYTFKGAGHSGHTFPASAYCLLEELCTVEKSLSTVATPPLQPLPEMEPQQKPAEDFPP